MRLIDADTAIEKFNEAEDYKGYLKGDPEIILNSIPTVDAVPVVHAHWNEIFDYTGTCYAECSRCGLLWWIEEGTAEENEMFYCPKCGAKMDEVVSE